MIEHQYVDMDEVRNNPNKPWNKHWLSRNKQLTVKDVKTIILPNHGTCYWNIISEHINIQEVINNPDQPWNRFRLTHNKGASKKILEFFDAGLLKHLQKNIYTFNYHTDMIVKCEY